MYCLKRFVWKPNVSSLARTYMKVAKTDPGIKRRTQILNSNQDNQEMEELEIDDMESDFMNLHKTHREHVQEVETMLEKEKFHIVKQKYFKETYPNFLTWHDKEQIRYLHSTNPEEWTIDRLSEGFPASPEVISKIIKSKWTKKQSKIANHDAAVQKNWEAFKTGQLMDLPKDLADHLNKFTNRSLNLKPFEIPVNKKVVKVINKNIKTEFSEIITSYEKLKKNNKLQDPPEELGVNVHNTPLPPAGDQDTCLVVDKKQLKYKQAVTLQKLQSNIETRALKGKVLSEEDKLLLKNLKEPSEDVELIELTQKDLPDVTTNKYETSTGAALAKKTERDYTHLMYPEKIVIPPKHRKKGYTYKLNDCYYDYDGLFLYRVPGMG